jgi:hypothetical protein
MSPSKNMLDKYRKENLRLCGYEQKIKSIIHPFLQNKANLTKGKIDVSSLITK